MEIIRDMINDAYNHLSGDCVAQDDEYIKDGLIYCKNCKTPRMFVYAQLKTRCLCKCKTKEREQKKQAETERERQLEIETCQKASLMGARYANADFRTTETGHNTTFNTAYLRCQKYCEAASKVLEQGLGMYIYGDKGTGKTHLTACMANALIRQRKQVLFTNFAEISRLLRATFGAKNENEADQINKLATIDFLFIDDLGVERVQTKDGDLWLQEKIFDVLNKRYNNRKPTVFTSNYSIPELISERGIAERTVDRIAEMSSAVLKIEGNSYRMRKRAAVELPF